MSSDEAVFRAMAAAMFLAMGTTRDGVRILGYLRSHPRPSLKEIWLDFLRSNRDARLGSIPLAILAGASITGILVYIADPSLMAWSAMKIPSVLRWIGVGLGWAGASGEMWAFVSLGKQYSPLLRIRDDHTLVSRGPYAWVRHPMYSFGLPMMAGMGLMTANWFIGATGVTGMLIAMIQRTPREEAMLTETFGDSYRRYMGRTGRFLPRLRAR